MQKVRSWRSQGLPVCYTIDAGPNVHVLCQQQDATQVEELLQQITAVQAVYRSDTGSGVQLV